MYYSGISMDCWMFIAIKNKRQVYIFCFRKRILNGFIVSGLYLLLQKTYPKWFHSFYFWSHSLKILSMNEISQKEAAKRTTMPYHVLLCFVCCWFVVLWSVIVIKNWTEVKEQLWREKRIVGKIVSYFSTSRDRTCLSLFIQAVYNTQVLLLMLYVTYAI